MSEPAYAGCYGGLDGAERCRDGGTGRVELVAVAGCARRGAGDE
ncbi:MAG: hypothetical protein ABSF95_23195 [Verrucomicrobiota bacterium]